jgi:hypothetical protein
MPAKLFYTGPSLGILREEYAKKSRIDERSRRAGPAGTFPVRGRPASTAGATAVPWLGRGELLALGSGSR